MFANGFSTRTIATGLLALGLVLGASSTATADVAPPTRPADPAPTERVNSVPMTAVPESVDPVVDPPAPHGEAGGTAPIDVTMHGGDNNGEPTHHTAGAHDGGHGHHDPTVDFNYVGGLPLSYKNLDIKGGPLGDGKLGVGEHAVDIAPGEAEEGMSAPFILMLVNFGLLLILLGKLGGPVARKTAEDRSDQIKHALDEAAKLRLAAQEKLAEYSKKLEAADEEIKTMVESIRAGAEADKKRVMEAADAQAAALKRDAELRIAAEIDRARMLLTREVGIASSRAAETILRERANAADHTKLVDAFVADLGRVAADSNSPGSSKELR